MKNRIGKRLVKSYLLLIITTIVLLDIFLLIGFRIFYYRNVENELINRLNFSINFYNRNYSDKNLEDIIIEDNDIFWTYTNAEVQILDPQGRVIIDSIGATYEEPITSQDFQFAKSGRIKPWTGKSNTTSGTIMAISSPIINSGGKTIGYLRFVASMEEANLAILKTLITLIIFSIILSILTAVVSILLSRTIVKPIINLTEVARKMADGQYKVKAKDWGNDEIGELAKTLNTMAEEILKKDQIKNDFISSISHELRTPLTSIKGWAVVLKDSKGDENLLAEGLSIIENETDRLSKMVEELLDFSRFISGRMTLEKELFDIAQTVKDVTKQMRPRANSNKIDLQIELMEEPCLTIGDENRIKQLLINIIDNAIKFTSENGWVKVQSFEEKNIFNVLVSDNGYGMNKTDLAHVKEKFYKGKHSKSHSGLGLSISDEIVKLHNGTLDIFSELNIGTTIKISLPITKEEEIA